MTDRSTIHVLHVVSGDLWAGAEVMLLALAKTLLDEKNIEVSVAILNPGTLEQKLRDCGITVSVIDETRLNSMQILKQLNRIVADLKPDVIHTHRVKENIIGSIAAWRNDRIPSLRTSHGADEHRPSWYQVPKHLIAFLDWFCGRFMQTKIIAVSPDLADILQKTFPANKIAVIENGIDIKALTALKKASTTNTSFIKIGIIGRLVPIKRVDLFIKSAKILKQKHPEFTARFHIYGDGPLHESLKQQSQQAGTDDIVYFEGHCEQIHDEIQTLDMLLMTSDHEGLPMTLLEAMALQIPIIAHAVGGIPRLLDFGKCGLLIDRHEPEAYADAIYQLLTYKELKTEITRRAHERVTMHFSAKQNADNYILQYRQLAR